MGTWEGRGQKTQTIDNVIDSFIDLKKMIKIIIFKIIHISVSSFMESIESICTQIGASQNL